MVAGENLKNSFCDGLSQETIEFIEKIATIYYNLPKTHPDISRFLTSEDLKNIAINIASNNLNDHVLNRLVESFTFGSKGFEDYFGLFEGNYFEHTVDYKFITDEFSYLFNNVANKKDITPKKIIKDSFKMNFGPRMQEFLADRNMKVNYDNFDEKYNELADYMYIRNLEESARKMLDGLWYEWDTKREIINVLKTYNYIIKKFASGEMNPELIKDKDDVKELALLIGILTSKDETIKFFEKNNVTIDNVLNFSGLTMDDIEKIRESQDVFTPFIEFKDYFDGKNGPSYAIFKDEVNQSQVLETISAKVSTNYKRLEVEVKTKDDYVNSLSEEDRIKELYKLDIEKFDSYDFVSILKFGTPLNVHKDYIEAKIYEIANNSKHGAATSLISDLVGKKKKGFFSKKENKPNVKDEHLKEVIEEKITSFIDDINKLKMLILYLNIYCSKCDEYINKLNISSSDMKSYMMQLDIDKDKLKICDIGTVIKVIEGKKDTFNISREFVNQEIPTVMNMINTYLQTINTLISLANIKLIKIDVDLNSLQNNNLMETSVEVNNSVFEFPSTSFEEDAVRLRA